METIQDSEENESFIFPLIIPDDVRRKHMSRESGNTRAVNTTELWFRDYSIDHSKYTFSEKVGQTMGINSRHAVDDEYPVSDEPGGTFERTTEDVVTTLSKNDIHREGQNELTTNTLSGNKYLKTFQDPHEETYCLFTGFCVVPDSDDFIICDYKSQTIKLINDHFIPTEKCKTLYEPWDVAVVDTNLIIVSFPFVRMIQYFKFRWKNKIVPWYPFISGNEYYGIAYDRGHVIATCMYDENQTSPSVHVIDKRGTIQHIIRYDNDMNNLFVEPKHIAVDKTCNTVYVLDRGNKSIITFGRNGDNVGKVTNICNDPSGITVNSADGTILICNRNPPAILNLTHDFEPLQICKAKDDNIWIPLSLQYNSKTSKLFVTMEKSSLIRVFEW